MAQLQRKLEAANVLVYSIATGSELRREDGFHAPETSPVDLRFGEILMRMLAATTGGQMYCPSCGADYAEAMQDIMDLLAGQYAVVYERAASSRPGFHKVKVEAFRLEADTRRNLKVLVRQGWRY
jgi:hypothetical protein